MSSFIPRRSARISAKIAAKTPTITPKTPVIPTIIPEDKILTKEEYRLQFLEYRTNCILLETEYTTKFINLYRQYLTDIKIACNKLSKIVIATRLIHSLIQNPRFIAKHTVFYYILLQKMKEFQLEKCPSNDDNSVIIYNAFHSAVRDLIYIIEY